MTATLKRLLARALRDERGELEDMPALVLLLVGVLFPLAAFLFIFAQHSAASAQVQAAAAAAARDVSLSGSPTDTQQRAHDAAELVLDDNLRCAALHVSVDDDGLHTALGSTGVVSATVTCKVVYLAVRLPGFPTTSTITKTASSPVDPYRERTP